MNLRWTERDFSAPCKHGFSSHMRPAATRSGEAAFMPFRAALAPRCGSLPRALSSGFEAVHALSDREEVCIAPAASSSRTRSTELCRFDFPTRYSASRTTN